MTFYYDETSPSKLRWAENRWSGRYRSRLMAKEGDVVGHVTKLGYYMTRKDGKNVFVHRIVWELHNGPIPPKTFIDHVDGNKLNNLIANLRLCNHKINARNSAKLARNVSGVTGVSLQARGTAKESFVAQWEPLNGKRGAKWFSVNRYGYEKAFALACEARDKAINELNSIGAGYTSRHGKDLP